MNTKRISVCLWFDNEAEEATKFYASVFKNSRIGKTSYYGESGAKVSGRKQGSVLTIEAELEGLKFENLNGGPYFRFSPGVSFFVSCENENEIDRLWTALSKGGSVIWELKKYPWSEKYGWCEDKYGVSWQLILGKSKDKIAPALLFMDKLFAKGEEAIQFYLSQFKNSKIETIARDPATGAIMHARFTLDGQEFVLMEGQKEKSIHITPAISFVVNCRDQDEVDRYWESLSAGGSKSQCGWLDDQYGVSWQIVPVELGEMMSDPDPARVERVMTAMLKMQKLDIARLKEAYRA